MDVNTKINLKATNFFGTDVVKKLSECPTEKEQDGGAVLAPAARYLAWLSNDLELLRKYDEEALLGSYQPTRSYKVQCKSGIRRLATSPTKLATFKWYSELHPNLTY